MTERDDTVFLAEAQPAYPETPPYHPDTAYPEYPFHAVPGAISDRPNHAYAAVRELLRTLGLDAARYGTAEWNPLGELVGPGQTVLLKPNWVSHFVHNVVEGDEQILDCLVTHTAVLRALIDYALIAVRPRGRVIVADAPVQGTDFALLQERAQMPALQQFYRDTPIPFEVRDLRLNAIVMEGDRLREHRSLQGDPQGYARINLGQSSTLTVLDDHADLYRVYGYDEKEILSTHGGGRHEYLIARTVLQADCIINVPKLKTHIKAGITAALKNLVGINGNKAFLPHYRMGAPGEQGDEYPVQNWVLRFKSKYRYRLSHYPDFVREPIKRIGGLLLALTRAGQPPAVVGNADPYLVSGGNWYGNDTTWRMVVDLNRILRYSDADGVMQKTAQRRVLSVVDGLVGGEGDGPLAPRPRELGFLVAGFNPLTIDAVCAQLIGMDWRKLALLRDGAPLLGYTGDLDLVEVQGAATHMRRLTDLPSSDFRAPRGWQGHVELNERTAV
jgi:uncharacterized protein (DUF362 family)